MFGRHMMTCANKAWKHELLLAILLHIKTFLVSSSISTWDRVQLVKNPGKHLHRFCEFKNNYPEYVLGYLIMVIVAQRL